MSVTYTLDKPVQAFYGEQFTVPGSGGTKTVFNRRSGFNTIELNAAAALRLHLAPRIGGIWRRSTTGVWSDLLAGRKAGSDGRLTLPYAPSVIDRGFTGQSLGLLSTERLYVGFPRKVNDLFVDVGATVNSVGSVLTCENSDESGGGFTALTITDGTDVAGATLGADGNITFTVPAGRAWLPRSLKEIWGEPTAPAERLFWLRFAVSVSLTAGTLIDQIAGFAEDDGAGTATGSSSFLAATTYRTYTLGEEVGALQFIAQAGGGTTVDCTWMRH